MKKFNRYSKIMALVVAMTATMFACVEDDYDKPDIPQIPIGDVYTIQQVKDFFNNNDSSTYTFTEDASVYATVTMDEETDNSYKTIFIQDNTAAIAVFQDVSGGVYIGDSVRVYLKDLVVMKYEGLFQINSIAGDGVSVDGVIIKQGYNYKRSPENATVAEIKADIEYYQGRLVNVTDIQFVDTDTSKTFANAADLETGETLIQDTADNQLVVRTSGYATFANADVPDGSGSLIAIVGQYGTTIQLTIRRISEVVMEDERFEVAGAVTGDEILNEKFDSDLGVFTQYSVSGTQVWIREEYSGNGYAYANGFPNINEDWLFSPAIDLTSYSTVTFKFRYALGFLYSEIFDHISVQVSSDYSGSGDPSAATWIEKTFTQAPLGADDWWTWTDSGNIDLSDFAGESSVYVAFKYTSTDSQSCAWEVDDVLVVAE